MQWGVQKGAMRIILDWNTP